MTILRAKIVRKNSWAGALAAMLGLLALLLLPANVIAQAAPQVTRSVDTASVDAGQTVSIIITPSGFTGFYAVNEELGELELVSHTADNYQDGTFIMLGPQPLAYVVRVPQTALVGDPFAITGQWWTDPGDKLEVTPSETVIGPTAPITPTPRATATPVPTATPTATAVPPTATPRPTVTPLPVVSPAEVPGEPGVPVPRPGHETATGEDQEGARGASPAALLPLRALTPCSEQCSGSIHYGGA